MSELEILQLVSQTEWEKWLGKNYNQAEAIWLKFAKKNSGQTTISYSEALEVALCYGWIDSQVKAFSNQFYLQKFSPRRPKSIWSAINREKGERLIKERRMKPPGLAQVEAAKADGRWENAYLSASNAVVPDDLMEALSKNKQAAEFFETLNKSNRYAIIFRLHHMKHPETRQRNIEKFVEMLANHQKFHP